MDASNRDATAVPSALPVVPRWMTRAIWAFLVLGVGLRLARYALNYPLWSDEAFVAANFLRRGYLELLRPLDYWQICPVLFLWAERAVVDALGFREWTLRLVPLLCGLTALGLFPKLASRAARGPELLLAVGIFAVSAAPIRHAAEVKAYAGDLLVALLLLTPALAWLRDRARPGWLWVLVPVAPIALAASHPAAFVAGGVSLGLVGSVWKDRRRAVVAPFLAFNAVVATTFVLLYVFILKNQDAAMPLAWRSYWDVGFPPLSRPLAFARWLVATHTGEMFGYPGGGGDGASTGTFLLTVAGALALWKRRERALLATLLGPFALTFLAAVAHKYPYGGTSRHLQFLAPSICVLAGIGGWSLIARLRSPKTREMVMRGVAAGLFAGGFVHLARSMDRPFYNPYDVSARAFAREFWPALGREAEIVCPLRDAGIRDENWVNLNSAFYLCNQEIYTPQRQHRAGVNWNAISADHPLRCMVYPGTSVDNPAFLAWKGDLLSRFTLQRLDDLPLTMLKPSTKVEHLLIFEFVPRPSEVARGTENAPRR
jgi:hypothetical protein